MVKEDSTFPNNLIKIGENKDENDLLVRDAHDNYIWFHLNNLPSCHIILECDKQNPYTKDMINHCAKLVKDNTKYKNIPKVKVIYTEIRNVKRTLEPGKVIIKGKPKSILV